MRAGIIHRWSAGTRRTPCAAAIALLLASLAAGPQVASAADEFSIPARRAARPPDIDGHVTEREWQGAARAGNFLQFQPQRGNPAELPTVVHVLYDDEFLYAGFQAWDPEPPLSQMVERDDPIWNDDSVQVFLDSFHDRRTGYYFMAQRARDAGRRAHRRGRRHQRRGVGRAVALAGAAHRLRLVGRDCHPP